MEVGLVDPAQGRFEGAEGFLKGNVGGIRLCGSGGWGDQRIKQRFAPGKVGCHEAGKCGGLSLEPR